MELVNRKFSDTRKYNAHVHEQALSNVMNINEITGEIYELNAAYMLLARRLLCENKSAAISDIGVSEQIADVLLNLSPHQALRLARSGQLLCCLRFDDYSILDMLDEKIRAVSICDGPAT